MEREGEVGLFQSVLEFNRDFSFYTAQLAVEQRRNSLRKPTDMPIEDDVKKEIGSFILSGMHSTVEDVYKIWEKHDFVKLRNLIVSRLTLYNARLTLSEWREAEDSVWVDPELAEKITDSLEETLLRGTKLAYIPNDAVPLLIPNNTVEAVRKLVFERANVGISGDNVFLFPNTNNSRDDVSGYNCIQSVAGTMGIN
ncbi:hypothetical protein RRG08_022756 [Elysia crispata]|uniref:Uncharacterized protein n=1 Tax=Elysia crispata TaxID=231223 RepID=A0AAE0ZXU2_9GAST|nr:hypothetical protein RRG08_022756 [Elysia crispata]